MSDDMGSDVLIREGVRGEGGGRGRHELRILI